MGERGPDGAPGPPGPEVCSCSYHNRVSVVLRKDNTFLKFFKSVLAGFPW